MSDEVWEEVYDRLAELIEEHRTTLVFVNTRRLAERVARQLARAARRGPGRRAPRQPVARAAPATPSSGSSAASCRRSSPPPRSSSASTSATSTSSASSARRARSRRFLQRVGRSGHAVGGMPKGRLFPLTRDELVECAALLRRVRPRRARPAGDPRAAARHPRAADRRRGRGARNGARTSSSRWSGAPGRTATSRASDFDAVVAHAGRRLQHAARPARRAAPPRRGQRRAARPARRAAHRASPPAARSPTSPTTRCVLEPEDQLVGTRQRGLRGREHGRRHLPARQRLLAHPARRARRGARRGRPRRAADHPVLARRGARPHRRAVAVGVAPARRDRRAPRGDPAGDVGAALADRRGRPRRAGRASSSSTTSPPAHAALGCLPTQDTLVLERFFDEAGGMQLVIHSPFGSRINRAWGWRCASASAASSTSSCRRRRPRTPSCSRSATAHSFPLDEVARYLHSATRARRAGPGAARRADVRRALALERRRARWRCRASAAASKVPPQLAAHGRRGPARRGLPGPARLRREPRRRARDPRPPAGAPDDRATASTRRWTSTASSGCCARLEAGAIEVVARDLTEPSPLAHEMLLGAALRLPRRRAAGGAPHPGGDGAALARRRRRRPSSARSIPRRSRGCATRPGPRPRTPTSCTTRWSGSASSPTEEARGERRAGASWLDDAGGRAARGAAVDAPGATLWIAAERLPQFRALWPDGAARARDRRAGRATRRDWSPEDALVEIVRGRLEGLGPVTEAALAAPLGLGAAARSRPRSRALEAEGFVLRGRFTPGGGGRGMVRAPAARAHPPLHAQAAARARSSRSRRATSCASCSRWQRVAADARMQGPDAARGDRRAARRLRGAGRRLGDRDPAGAHRRTTSRAWLDDQCLAGPHRLGAAAAAQRRAERRRAQPWRRCAPRRSRCSPRRHARALGGAVAPRPDERRARARARRRSPTASASTAPRSSTSSSRAPACCARRSRRRWPSWWRSGLVTSDSFAGLRALLVPSERRKPGRRRRGAGAAARLRHGGRRPLGARCPAPARGAGAAGRAEAVEHVARTLLRRYGVVFWRLLEREAAWLPPWRDLLRVYRRLEARGEIRGGRFVAGFAGEQFALPDAVGALREARRRPAGRAPGSRCPAPTRSTSSAS